MKMTAAFSLVLFTSLLACEGEASGARYLAPTDPYIMARYAMMNYGGCKFVRAQRRLVPAEVARRNAEIEKLEIAFASVETSAKTKGLANYLALGRTTFTMRISAESHVGCYPDELKAMRRARTAVKRFQEHVENFASTGV